MVCTAKTFASGAAKQHLKMELDQSGKAVASTRTVHKITSSVEI